MLDKETLEKTLAAIEHARIGVIGDFTLDAYWLLDSGRREISIETGKPTHAVVKQTYSLGGAGNVVRNLVDLNVGHVSAFGVISGDIFGHEMRRQLKGLQVDMDGLLLQENGWDTPVYAKPYLGSEEQERIDFGRFNSLDAKTEYELIECLRKAVYELEVLIVNQQLPRGIYSKNVMAAINELAAKSDSTVFLLDSRNRTEEFSGMICKVNAAEASKICGELREYSELVPVENVRKYARQIYGRTNKPVYITRSGRGLILYDGRRMDEIPGIQILRKIDPVGAGDTTVSTIAAVIAAGGDLHIAGGIGNLAASVTVQKLQQTGTATPYEIVRAWDEADYIFNPELADDMRLARFAGDSEIEIVASDLTKAKIEHAIFDHDGTISTLRQGWETIMEPVMVRTILGESYQSVDEEIFQRVTNRVREYINQSTGIETIIQMEALVQMVREFGIVDQSKVLSAEAYKEIYIRALIESVDRRLRKLRSGELDILDLSIKGAVDFLRELKKRGVKLYLASGTDQEYVVREAQALGYAELFEGRIYGYTGRGSVNTKRRVVQEIIGQNRLAGTHLACFGDGPVELRETKRAGGIAVGVASDEVRRYGLNQAKRSRLIKGGADIIIPDFSQADTLMEILMMI